MYNLDYQIDYGNNFVKSQVRSKSLVCNSCGKKIKQGHHAIFELKCNSIFKGVHCYKCFNDNESLQEAFSLERHPFDLDD